MLRSNFLRSERCEVHREERSRGKEEEEEVKKKKKREVRNRSHRFVHLLLLYSRRNRNVQMLSRFPPFPPVDSLTLSFIFSSFFLFLRFAVQRGAAVSISRPPRLGTASSSSSVRRRGSLSRIVLRARRGSTRSPPSFSRPHARGDNRANASLRSECTLHAEVPRTDASGARATGP